MASLNKKARRAEKRATGTAELIAHFHTRFGRNPGPADPLLWKNGAVRAMTPDEMDTAYERLFTMLEISCSKSEPASVYAARKTGLVVSSLNRALASAAELTMWNAAKLEWEVANRPMVRMN